MILVSTARGPNQKYLREEYRSQSINCWELRNIRCLSLPLYPSLT